MILAAGERVPEATVWRAPHDRVPLTEVLAEGPALFVFYLFDWSAT
jgi:hypothetical protein